MATHTGTRSIAGMRPNTIVAFLFGAVFVLVGLLGFTVASTHAAVGHEGGELLGLFQVNMLHNLVHVAVGAVMIGAAVAGARAAKLVNTVVGAVYLVLVAVGLLIVGNDSLNIIALNGADNLLHLGLGLALVAAGLGLDRR